MHRLIPVKDSLQQFELTVKSHLACLDELLRNDDDMVGILLSERERAGAKGGTVDDRYHQVVELLIEDYNRQLEQILMEINYLQKKVQSSQELVAMSLDAYRNRMIRMNLHLTVGTVCLGVCTTVAGFFGMNLLSGLEEVPGYFWPTVAGSLGVGGGVFAGCKKYLSGKEMQRRARERAGEVESVTGVLRDMNSLDYAVKRLITDKSAAGGEWNGGEVVARSEFRKMLERGRGGGRVTEGELDVIFSILDESNDGVLHESEFKALAKGFETR